MTARKESEISLAVPYLQEYCQQLSFKIAGGALAALKAFLDKKKSPETIANAFDVVHELLGKRLNGHPLGGGLFFQTDLDKLSYQNLPFQDFT